MRSSGASEQRKVLHVARADLNHVAVFFNQIDARFVQCFGDDLQTVNFANFGENLKTLFTEPLESIRRSAGLECSSAKEACTAATH